MYSQPLADAIAEAERLVAAAPFIESEADLLEGLQYLAGCIAACTHVAFDYDRDHPFLHSGTGPFTKMGLDNPDTMYFGTRVQPGHEYVVTGKRGTTTDVSFQLLGGEYTDDNVPDSRDGVRRPQARHRRRRHLRVAFHPVRPVPAVIREVYNDWSAQRGNFAIARTDTAGTAPPPLTKELIEKRYAVAGKQLVQRVKTWLQFPQWFYTTLPGQHDGRAAADAGRAGHPVLVGRAFRPDRRTRRSIITVPVTDAPYLGFQLGSLWYISLDYINHQTSLNGTQAQADPDGKIRIVVSDQNPGVTNWVETLGHRKGFLQFRWQRVSRELTEADGPDRRARRPRRDGGGAAVLRAEQDLRGRLARADRAAPEANWRQDGGVADGRTCSRTRSS